VAQGTYETGTPLDLGWIVGALIIALAAWQPGRRETGPTDDVPSITLPVVLSHGSLALLVIVFVCDAYSAMRSERPHARALSGAEALAELRRHAGTQFSPAVADAFLRAVAQEQVAARLVQR
jgi:hypothetical protein